MTAYEASVALRITGLGMFLFGCVALALALRARWAHPPGWVAEYRGHGSIVLGLLPASLWAMLGIAITLDSVLPDAVIVWLTRLWLVAFIATPVAMWIWYPRALCPAWYRRARRAGVDVTSPDAVESFRRLPVDAQRQQAEAGPRA